MLCHRTKYTRYSDISPDAPSAGTIYPLTALVRQSHSGNLNCLSSYSYRSPSSGFYSLSPNPCPVHMGHNVTNTPWLFPPFLQPCVGWLLESIETPVNDKVDLLRHQGKVTHCRDEGPESCRKAWCSLSWGFMSCDIPLICCLQIIQ